MKKKGQIAVGALILLFIGIVVGLALINSTSESVGVMTKPQSYSETINISSAFIDDNNINTSKVFYLTKAYVGDNEYKSTFGSECYVIPTVLNAYEVEYVDPTDVVRIVTGQFTLKNTTKVLEGGDVVDVEYTYCEYGYNKDSGSRTVVNLVMIFMALMLLTFVLEYSGVTSFTKLFD